MVSDRSAEEQAADDRDEAFEMAEDLFLDVATEDLGLGQLEQARQERVSGFVSVFVGGREIVFLDVPEREWYAPYVRSVAEQGIISGYRDGQGVPTGIFGPERSVSREELAKIAVLMRGMDPSSCPSSPKNLTASGSWSQSYVSCAEQAEFAVFSDGSADVKAPATRSEVVATILDAMKAEPIQVTGSGFTDVPASILFAGSIERAKQDGVISGYADSQGVPIGLFGPSDPVKRAELAKIVSIALQIYIKK